MKKSLTNSKPRITKKTKHVKSKTQESGTIIGTEEYNKFVAGEGKKATDQKPAGKTKPDSWKIHLSEKQWREEMKKLNPVQRCILIDFNFYARTDPDAFPAIGKLAKNIGASPSSIKRHLPGLVKKGIVRKIKRNGTSDLYELKIRF